jgi:osmotically inducible protein OsmC
MPFVKCIPPSLPAFSAGNQYRHGSQPETGTQIMIKKANAAWTGHFKGGGGVISTESGVLDQEPYGVKSRFESNPGTNPEELIAAAHAGCFSMALALSLGNAGLLATKIETLAAVTLEKVGNSFVITASHLEVVARVSGVDQAKFLRIANEAKLGCPVSKLLKAKITMHAELLT